MNPQRYLKLNGPDDHALTADEISDGWHFCDEFDGLLRNSNEEPFKCGCNEFQDQQHDSHCCDYSLQAGLGVLCVGERF